MKRLVLALPVLFLALSLDRVLPEKTPPLEVRAAGSLESAIAGLPGMNEGRFERPGNPLNLVFAGSEEAVRGALAGAGWTEVPSTIRASFWAGLIELLAGKTLAAAPPMNEYWLNGRRQDMNWAIAVRPLSARHHFRLWDSGLRDARGRAIWWGAGDYDLEIRWHDLSHVRDPDLDAERDWIAASLKNSTRLEKSSLILHAGIPRSGVNDKGYAFHTDGRVALIELK